MNCSSCGAPLPQGIAYCPSCQKSIPSSSQANELPAIPTSKGSSGRHKKTRLQKADPTVLTDRSYGPRLTLPQTQGKSPSSLFGNISIEPAAADSMPLSSSSVAAQVHTESQNNPTTSPLNDEEILAPAVFREPSPSLGTHAVIGASPKRRAIRKFLVFFGIAVAIVLSSLVGVVGFLNKTTDNASTPVTIPTGTLTTPITTGPSGQKVSLTAATIITDAHTSSAITSNYIPAHLTSTFHPNQTIYVTFVINSQNTPGYSMIKWYSNSQLVGTDTLQHNVNNNVAFFSKHYTTATQGTAELYWCTQSSCRDAQLAQVQRFEVINISATKP